MAYGSKPIKTEHAGAKNSGGFWGKRAWAKLVSNIARRKESRRLERESARDYR